MKKILTASAFAFLLMGCEPQQSTQDDKEAVKQDTVDPREGKGEGEVGEGVYGH